MEKPFGSVDAHDLLTSDYDRYIAESLRNSLVDFYDIQKIKDACPDKDQMERTPYRIVKAMLEMFRGCWQNPEEVLQPLFDMDCDEIVYMNAIPFVSNCAHHNLPFFGKAYFAYLPNGKIVGLSKIPRLVTALSRRPQVQEKLTSEIVDTFTKVVNPRGCGLVIEAYHLCVIIRGVESDGYTKTSALRGIFKENISTKQEFFDGIRKTTETLWP